MARIRAVLTALVRLSWREISTDRSITGNNLLLILYLMLYGGTQAAGFPVLVVGASFLLAVSTHPLSKIPVDRLVLWPLSGADRVFLRIVGMWLNPAFILILPLLLLPSLRSMAAILLATVMLLQAIPVLLAGRRPKLGRIRPRLKAPTLPGVLGELIRKDIRQLATYLDLWVSLALCVGATAYRFAAEDPEPEAAVVISVLTAVIMGTPAQCLFGLDGPAGISRYRLLPLRGWQVLAAKGVAWLVLLIAQTALLSPLAAVSAGLVALSVGHHRSVYTPSLQRRWRFSNGSLFMLGVGQTFLTVSAGVYVARFEPRALLACAAVYIVSLLIYGRLWDRAPA